MLIESFRQSSSFSSILSVSTYLTTKVYSGFLGGGEGVYLREFCPEKFCKSGLEIASS